MHANKTFLSLPEKIPVTYITTSGALAVCINELSQEKIIAFDLEFDRDHYTYGFNLCLMQIASASQCYLIDPNASLDISLTFRLLEDPGICKVVHSSAEDLRLLHSIKCYPKNLVDTEIYARLLNYERPSLGAVIERLYGTVLDKKMQKVNWELRPLGTHQLAYAANDVLYLLGIKNELEKQAMENNLLPFLQSENNLLSTTIHHFKAKENFLKSNDLLYLSPYDQYILNGLFVYRDGIAKKQNRPAHYIMNDETIRNLAANIISAADWLKIKGLHPVMKSSEGKDNLFKYIQNLNREAKNKNLSSKKGKRAYADEDFKKEKLRKELLKATIFTPIQNDIAATFGEHAMRFIMSTSTVDAIVHGQLKIGEMTNCYRTLIVKSTAHKLGIDISEFE